MGKDRTDKLKKYIKENRPSRFKSFVRKHKIDIREVQLSNGQNLLHYCCRRGQDIIFRFLLKEGSDCTHLDYNGDTPLHHALRLALKSSTNTVYTTIVLPLLENSPHLLEVANNDGITCRHLLDKLVQKRQTHDNEEQFDFHQPETSEASESWEEKLANEFRNEYDDSTGRYYSDSYDNKDAESYDEWAERLRREYHMKHKYGGRCQSNKGETTTTKTACAKDNLEDIRRKMREKYEENQRRDRENRILQKSRNYLKNITALQSHKGVIKFDDVPWPYNVDVVEIKKVMFQDVLTNDEAYKKRLREEQIRWHPDKFLQKHGQLLCEIDKDRIMERVKEISQELNRLNDLA